MVEEENRQLRSGQECLENQIKDYIHVIDSCKRIITRHVLGLDKVLPILGELREDPSLKNIMGHKQLV